MPQSTYTEEEVAALFKRAAELQAQRDAAGGGRAAKHGLTLDELTAIAADAGLDPELLRVAAGEIAHPAKRRKTGSTVSGGTIVAERWLQGRLDDFAKEDIVAELRHRFDTSSDYGMSSHGKSTVQTVGRSMEWQHANPWTGTETRALIQPRNDDLRIRVTQKNTFSGSATGWSPLYGPLLAIFAGLIVGPLSGSLLIGLLVAVLMLVTLTPLMVKMSRSAEQTQRREVEEVADMIAAHAIPVPVAGGAIDRASEEREPGLAIDEPEVESESEHPSRLSRSRRRST